MATIRENNSKQYFIGLIPPRPIYDDALKLQQYFAEKYNSSAALRSPPHITLHMPFRLAEQKESVMIRKLSLFAARFDPVKICLDNFAAFAPRVIFINVAKSEALSHFQKGLERFCKTELNLFNASYRDDPYHPHLTLAFRDLKKNVFPLAWKEFESKEFKAEFMADKLTVLKHDGKKWLPHKDLVIESSFATDVTQDLETTEG